MADILQFKRRPSMVDEVADLIDRWMLFDARLEFAQREGLLNPRTVEMLEQELALLQADLERVLLVVQGRRIQ